MLVTHQTAVGTLYIDHSTGEVFATASALANITETHHTTIKRYVENKLLPEGGTNTPLETAETLTTGGLQRGHKISEPQILSCIAKFKPELLQACAAAGLRVYLHGLAGYDYKPVATQPALPAADKFIAFGHTLEFLGIDAQNPRWKQHLQDIGLTMLGVGQQPALPAERWQGVREAAEELGYMSVAVNKASQLGKLVKLRHPNLEVKVEERLCNGLQRPIRLYRVCPAFTAAVADVCEELA